MARKKEEPRSLIASATAVDFNAPVWSRYDGTDEVWQSEIWRLYDVVPEFSRGANWVGSACSRVRIYVAEVDANGQIQQEVKSSSPVAKYAYSVLGGPERQAELLRLMGVQLTVAGESWIVAFDAGESDKWYAVSRSELRRIDSSIQSGTPMPSGEYGEVFEFFDGRAKRRLVEGQDIFYRCWTPHPYRFHQADSPGRSLQMVLVELEILTQYILAQARSRLASAGVWIWPTGTDFPSKDSDPVDSESLMKRMLDAGEKNMRSFGSASQVLPMIVEMPEKVFDRIKPPIQFGSELSKEAMALRKELRERLAAGMDIAPEIVTGMGEATGWNTFSITADTVETVVKPIMARICNAATEVWLKPHLRRSRQNEKRYKFWFDTAALTIRPQRLKETMEMYELDLVAGEQVLIAADLPPTAAMGPEERSAKLARAMLRSDTNLVLIPSMRKEAGLNIEDIVPDGTMPGQDQQPGIAGRAPAPPPPERTLKEGTGPTVMPRESTRPGNPDRNPEPVAASMELALVVAADAAVRSALEQAGKALRRAPEGKAFRDVPADEVYLHLPPREPGHAYHLVAKSWQHLDALMENVGRTQDTQRLRETLASYCVDRMTGEGGPRAHEVRVMRGWLQAAGLL